MGPAAKAGANSHMPPSGGRTAQSLIEQVN
jgi:hypothetical protein